MGVGGANSLFPFSFLISNGTEWQWEMGVSCGTFVWFLGLFGFLLGWTGRARRTEFLDSIFHRHRFPLRFPSASCLFFLLLGSSFYCVSFYFMGDYFLVFLNYQFSSIPFQFCVFQLFSLLCFFSFFLLLLWY